MTPSPPSVTWKSPTMVARYAHLSDEKLREAAASVAELVDLIEADDDPGVKEPRGEYRAPRLRLDQVRA